MGSATKPQPPSSIDSDNTEIPVKDMLRDCVELCARMAEERGANEVAMAIRRLKPPTTWP